MKLNRYHQVHYDHIMMQDPFPGPFGRVLNDTRAASLKTSVTPRLCFALHSAQRPCSNSSTTRHSVTTLPRYREARIRRATATPSSYWRGRVPYR